MYQYTPLYLYRGWLSSIIGYQYRVRAYQYADVYQYRGGRTSTGEGEFKKYTTLPACLGGRVISRQTLAENAICQGPDFPKFNRPEI